MTELSYNMVLIKGNPFWSGRARHAYGHLLFTQLDEGLHHIDQLQILRPNVIPHGVRCEGLLRVLSWVSFDLPAQLKRTLSALLRAAGAGCQSLHDIEIECRDVRDPPIESEQALHNVLIGMIPTPGSQKYEGGQTIRNLLTEFPGGFSLRTLVFLLDMVLPQLDAYHCGRQMRHLQPWESVALVQEQVQHQQALSFPLRHQYEAYADFHVLTLATEGAPILFFGDSASMPQRSPWELCQAGDLGCMESNVMAGRVLLGLFKLPDGQDRCFFSSVVADIALRLGPNIGISRQTLKNSA